MAKPTAAEGGALSAAVTVAGSDVLPAAGKLQSGGMSILDQYQAELEGLLSTDPAMRMEANAANISDINALAQGERQQVANMPRGGAQAYENGLIDQNVETQIGNALSNSFNQALTAEGQLGQYETTTGLQGDIQAAGLDISAAGGYDGLAKLIAAGDSSALSFLSSAAADLISL